MCDSVLICVDGSPLGQPAIASWPGDDSYPGLESLRGKIPHETHGYTHAEIPNKLTQRAKFPLKEAHFTPISQAEIARDCEEESEVEGDR